MAQVVSHWPVATDSWVRSQAIQCGVYGGISCTGTEFYLSTSVLTCHYHFAKAP
jgi:hypothetical protein